MAVTAPETAPTGAAHAETRPWPEADRRARAPRDPDRPWLWFGILAAAIAIVAFAAAADIGRTRAIATVRAQANDAGTLAIAVLRGLLEKQRALPMILSRDPDVRATLLGKDPKDLDQKLEAIARETRSAVIYLINTDGLAISASNWNEQQSFVNSNYGFRDYFRQALANGGAEQYALGTVSKRPGLYITRRIDVDGKPLGVIVVKVEFDQVEADWRALGGEAYVADPRGVVLLTTLPDWRFRVEQPLSPAIADETRRSLQFGAAPLLPLPLKAAGDLVTVQDPASGRFVSTRFPVPTTDWQLNLLLPIDRAVRDERLSLQTLVALVLMPGLTLIAFVLLRRQRAIARRLEDEQVKAELERRVGERTAELAGANARLVNEVAERARALERLSDAREELAKANRLATMGQIAAGVAHEINQPLAAIRTYAENARQFVQRQQPGPADGALGKVVSLTERIGVITEALRGFARRGGGGMGGVSVAEAIEGALMILDAQLRHADIVPEVAVVAADLKVLARKVEMEQVLVNLLRNAIDAIGDIEPARRPGRQPLLTIGVGGDAAEVIITVSDRGAGMDEEALSALFTPFRTTKPRGLGLGLVISRDIVTAFGGTLTARSQPGDGSVFTVALKRAL